MGSDRVGLGAWAVWCMVRAVCACGGGGVCVCGVEG